MPRFHVKHLLVAALLCFAAATVMAQKMYRCPSPGGGTTFSDTPCPNAAGEEIRVKPAAGAAGQTPARPDPQTRGAMDRRLAEYDALLSPECRRARQAFQAKADQKGGMDELTKEGNPISKAWEACLFEAQDALGKQNAAEQSKRVEQDRLAQKRIDCAAKQKLLEERRPRMAQLAETERAALRVLESEYAQQCR